MSDKLSVANDIKALALINVQDIFRFTLTATDEQIMDRYGSEQTAVDVAERYMDIAYHAGMMEQALKGWEMKYSMPIANSDERKEYIAKFYDDKGETESEKEKDKIRIYSKIFADEEPQDKAEKIYQICRCDELKEVVSWLREYAESEE